MPTETMQFAQRVVWITGAAGGVGAATARMFARAGATLVLSDLSLERLQALATGLEGESAKAHLSPGDLREAATARAATDLIARILGRLDILVNCIGFNVPDRSWRALGPAGVDSVLETNLAAPFYCALAALDLMRPRKSGLLIHIASTDGLRVGTKGGPAYSASKHGLVAMSHSINLEEAANGIRSSVICPGGIDTGFLDHRPNPPSAAERARLLRPAEVADVVRYIASTPETVRIDQVTVTPRL